MEGITFLYALVARGQTVLTEHTDLSGNFPTVTRVILRKISHEDDSNNNDDKRCTFIHEHHRFHFIKSSSLVYLIMTSEDAKTSVVFKMLEEIKNEFNHRYNYDSRMKSIAYAMKDFDSYLATIMKKYECSSERDAMDVVNAKMNSVKNVMVENINKVLERGEKIDLLVEKTEHLQVDAYKFGETATSLKRVMWWKNVKLMLGIGVLVVILLWLISSFVCGFDYSVCGSQGGGGIMSSPLVSTNSLRSQNTLNNNNNNNNSNM